MPAVAATGRLEIVRRVVRADLYGALPDNLNPVLRRIFAARHLKPGELSPSLSDLLPVSSLTGAPVAARSLAEARERQSPILVVGDFDADGATAAALTVMCLGALGFKRVSFLVPNRFAFGYGLSPEVVEQAAGAKPELIITVDNGITSLEGVARAAELGMRVIITDHHLPGVALPSALAMVNPNLSDEPFASKNLAGVGVAFYVMAALARELADRGIGSYDAMRRAVTDCLDLVALGTVADLVKLDSNNRILVAEGLKRIRAGRARPGIAALFAVSGRDVFAARTADLGFAIAPRLNAAGRLTDMSLGVECLLCRDPARARVLAAELDALNLTRRDLQVRMVEQADEHVRRLDKVLRGSSQDVYCLFDEEWHEGIVGLVASRVKERTGRPVIAFATGEQSGMLKGSARSVDGLHIRDALAAVSAAVPGMNFGGHAMAAGVRIPATSLEIFRRTLIEEIGQRLDSLSPGRVLWTDGPLAAPDLHLELAEQIEIAAPWGQGFPEPLFDNEFEVLDQRILKDAHLKLVVRLGPAGEPADAIAFNHAAPVGSRTRLLYRLAVNSFGGRRRSQLVVEHVHSD